MAGFLTMDARFVLVFAGGIGGGGDFATALFLFTIDARFALVFAGGIGGGGAFAPHYSFL